MSAHDTIRRPAVAGMFYPRDASALADAVDALLSTTAPCELLHPARVLVSPHAGYAYSGAVAANAFRCIEPGRARTFILVGPSHVDAFDFSSVFAGDAYRTPLGDVPVDGDVARALAARVPSIRVSTRGHVLERPGRGEHGIEVLLPFLQRVAPDARIVPIVMGSQTWNACETLGAAIARECDARRTIVVASSDLSHFHAYDEAVRLDQRFCDEIERLDALSLLRAVDTGSCEACGAGPVAVGMLASAHWRERSCRVLARANSGDVSGDRASVVGYAAAVIAAGDAA